MPSGYFNQIINKFREQYLPPNNLVGKLHIYNSDFFTYTMPLLCKDASEESLFEFL
jgi:hypothetical protein